MTDRTPNPKTAAPLPDGFPGYAASPIDEAIEAIDGDNGTLYVRHPGKRAFRAIGSPDLWRFRPARYRDHGWWCDEAEHLRCAHCLEADHAAAWDQALRDLTGGAA
jgi:hypothetical protein